MKKVFLFALLIISPNLFSQKYDLNSHPLISKVWRSVYIDSTTEVRPIGFKSFCFDHKYINENIDEIKIQNYLFESLNKFRIEYGIKPVLEDTLLTNSSIEFAKQIFNDYNHHFEAGKLFNEAIAIIPRNMLSRISKQDGDFNKIVADCCFDMFVGSPGHMAILLDENQKIQFGVGASVKDGDVSIVVRSVRKK
jgi:hypothetical protein